MKILITSYGTRGDVQPYVALGLGLVARGHQVLIVTSSRFEEFVRGRGLDFSPLSDELLSILDRPEGKDLLEKSNNLIGMLSQGIKLKKQVGYLNEELLRQNWKIAKEFSPDLIIYHPKSFGAPHCAEKLKAKVLFATPIPIYIPTSEFSFINFPRLGLGGWYNRLSFGFVKKLTEVVTKPYINKFRDEIGLKIVSKIDVTQLPQGGEIPVIHLHSESVLPKPKDWPKTAHVTGYCFLDEEESWEPPSELTDFLGKGAPPIYIGFGSMTGRNPESLAHIIVEALKKTNQRGIIASGWGGLAPKDLPETIFSIDQVPHHWLFSRVSAVIHHGGAGSTAAGLRAGRPTLIIPFFGDQPFWGQRIFEIGVGPKPIPRKKLTVKKLSDAIGELVNTPSIAQRALQVGEAIRSEDGVSRAIEIIES